MLPCRPAHADTALYNTVDLTVSLADLTLFIIFFHITKCGLVCQRTDRAGTEGLTFSENNLRILMRFTLVISGEVQVDIRLFVSLKAKESLKWDIMPLFFSSLCHISDNLYPAYRSRTYPRIFFTSSESKSL